MRDLRPVSYRVLLLASVASVALGANARAASYNNTSPASGAGPSYSLHSGDTLANPSSITSTGASQPAVQVNSGATSITNSGLIQATGANGIGVQVVSGGSVGTITNSGTIQTTTSGSAIVVGDTIGPEGTVGTLTNSGLIQSAGASAAIQVNTFGSVASIANLSGGTIQALGAGSGIFVAGTVGSISNGGLIQSNTGSGIDVAAGGMIQATGAGAIAILNNGTIGGASGIVNSGEIMAPLGTAIAIGSTGIVINGITNTATGLIEGGPSNGSGVAIDDSAGTNKLAITTAGTIIGAIKLGPAGDTLNVTGGSITGNVTGQSGSNDILNFNPTGTFTTGGSIANVDTVNVDSNTVVLQNPVSSAIAFNVASGATVALNANVAGTNLSFYNAGMVNVGSGNPTITGNYTQASGATLGVTIFGAPSAGSSGAGELTVSKAATIQSGTNAVSVHVPTTVNDFGLVGNTYTVLASSTLAVTGSLSASSDNNGIAFGLTDSNTALILSALTQSSSQILAAAANDVTTIFAQFPGVESPSEQQARQFLTLVFVELASHGDLQLADKLDALLTNLSPAQVLQFNNQLLPSTIQSVGLELGSATNALSAGEATIFGRLTTARLDTTQSGLAAGDAVGRGFTFWGQPFGAITSQGMQDGIDGYNVGTYGVTLGGDTMVTPNFRLGLALTLSNSNISYTGSLSGNTGTVFTGELGLYGSYYWQNFFVDGLLSAAYNHYTRQELISALGLTLNSDNGGTQLSAKIGAGYDFKVGNGAVITPYVSLQQFHFNFGSYTTSGGSADDMDTHVDGQGADLTQSRFGARLTYPVTLSNGGLLTPEVHAYWLHDFGSNQLTTTYTSADFASPSTFTSVGPPADRDLFNIGIGATFARGPAWSFGGGYDYLGSTNSNAHNFYLRLKLDF